MDSGWTRTDPEEFCGVDSASQDEVRNIVQYICLDDEPIGGRFPPPPFQLHYAPHYVELSIKIFSPPPFELSLESEPLCVGIIKTARDVIECLHRFYRECVDKFMRLGNNECHACRTHCASRRSLRDVLRSDILVNSVYPDVEKYEQVELVLYEDVKAANEQKLDLYEEEKAANVQYPICLGTMNVMLVVHTVQVVSP